MALHGLELHHRALRVPPEAMTVHVDFYRDVLGLAEAADAPEVPGIPIQWLDAANGVQVHLFGAAGTSRYAARPDRDPFISHLAFGVPDITEAVEDLVRMGVPHWHVGRGERRQVFVRDPSGDLIELHQSGLCRCVRTPR
ncbi:catechol 2,3-dioxygenase-like lactoylglutathione lyase family enzyme [Actinocorallia herbida]|uniref:Catechol 2,3-dioxygenase-like lactoylglutathione lyase family enzyme n=1 Tax=Actinocorallia herbida TaxID=58109 RepID=A0A3N1D4K3_9ACTN|nr:VOC family protein [Actinocorallia herbida]ROO88018.1 catechol 2,3-dioxygenase-like lactoylglutathione lyase family enzyme [Actinocorallia herbida]